MTLMREIQDGALEAQSWFASPCSAKSGLVVFSSSRELLHISREASRWLRPGGRPDRLLDGYLEPGALPGAVTCLLDELLHIVAERTVAADWRRIEITSVIHVHCRRLLLRGFGIPDERGVRKARVAMAVEEARLDDEPLSGAWMVAGKALLNDTA
jgi:hypothetical protein